MLLKTYLNASAVLFLAPTLVSSLSPGSFFFENVFFSGGRAFSGLGPGVAVINQGMAVTTSLVSLNTLALSRDMPTEAGYCLFSVAASRY